MGLLTIKDYYRGNVRLEIPNEVIRLLYYDYFAEVIRKRSGLELDPIDIRGPVTTWAWENNPRPLVILIEKTLRELSNRDWPGFDEKHLKAILITYLYSSNVYFIKSEPEVRQKYPDLIFASPSPL